MLHTRRIWTVANVPSEEDLAAKLVDHIWCTCNGFRFRGYLFLNDATCPDGAQEYAIIKEITGLQVESITFSWCSYYRALQLICEIVAGRYDAARYCPVPCIARRRRAISTGLHPMPFN